MQLILLSLIQFNNPFLLACSNHWYLYFGAEIYLLALYFLPVLCSFFFPAFLCIIWYFLGLHFIFMIFLKRSCYNVHYILYITLHSQCIAHMYIYTYKKTYIHIIFLLISRLCHSACSGTLYKWNQIQTGDWFSSIPNSGISNHRKVSKGGLPVLAMF